MYYKYDKKDSIEVPHPFKRAITPMHMEDTSTCPTNFSVHITEWEPGCQIDLHDHPDGMEAMFCISGQGKASVNGVTYDFVPFSMIVAGPGDTHQISNTGSELLRVLCVFSPPVTGDSLRKRAMEAVKSAEDND